MPNQIHTTQEAADFPTAAPRLAANRTRVLIADDDPAIRQLLEDLLQEDGYTVISTSNGHELVQIAQQHIPDLILVDLMMPQMDGYEAIRQLRNDTRTAHIPMLILTAQIHTRHVVVGFESGADDYITKPFDTAILLARIQSQLRRAAQRPVHNPLTGLPGNGLLLEEMRYRLERAAPLALLYVDLDNFKVFNDSYGFARGDEAIMLVAHLVQHAVAIHNAPDVFVGHIGGDDFAILTAPSVVDGICQTLIASFDRAVGQLYHPDDLQRGFLSGLDRHGMLRRFSLLSISIGVVTTERRSFGSASELARVAAEMKYYAKTQPGSSYAVNRRMAPPPRSTSVTTRRRVVLVVSDDASLRIVLRTALGDAGYTVHEAVDLATRPCDIEDGATLVALLADARIGEPLWAFCRAQKANPDDPAMIILAASAAEEAQARAAGVATVLRQPLPINDVIDCVSLAAGARGGRASEP
jgi:DNA-binding response OmpR family regulator